MALTLLGLFLSMTKHGMNGSWHVCWCFLCRLRQFDMYWWAKSVNNMLANPKVHCVRGAFCFFSASVLAFWIAGRWAVLTEPKQESPHTQLILFPSSMVDKQTFTGHYLKLPSLFTIAITLLCAPAPTRIRRSFPAPHPKPKLFICLRDNRRKKEEMVARDKSRYHPHLDSTPRSSWSLSVK